MESISIGISSSPHFPQTPKFHKPKTPNSIFLCTLNPNSIQFLSNSPNKTPITHFPNPLKTLNLSSFFLGFQFPLSSFASEAPTPVEISPNKINLEQILVSIDDFFNKYPFFVSGVVFIWLFVIPVTQEYMRKYKFISAIDAFKKLKGDPSAQLLDVRDRKSLRVLGSPNLKILGKSVVQVEFVDGDEEGFVKKVKESFEDPENTVVCVLDNFDGDSMKAAELLFNSGFKEAYAIRGGVRGDNGWQEIQETLLPPSVHIYAKKKVKNSKRVTNNGAVNQQDEVKSQSEQTDNGYVNASIQPNPSTKRSLRSSSPYPMYPDMKPPSSPTPSKPQKQS